MKIKHIALLASLFLSIAAIAQHNEEVTVEGSYRPKVNKVKKIVLSPETPQQMYEMPSTETHVMEVKQRFPLKLEKLTPQLYNGKNAQVPVSTKNFLMVGFGSRISPEFLYKHNSNLTKTLGLEVGIKHYSSWLDMKDYAPSSFMNNAFNIGLTTSKFNNLQLGGNVYYMNDMYHYYGVKVEDLPFGFSLDSRAPRQIYNTIGASFDLTSTNTRNGEFVHALGLDYHYLFDQVYAGEEHYANLDYDMGYVDNWWGSKEHPQKLGVALNARFDKNHMGVTDAERLIFKVNPYFEMKDTFYRLHLGVRMDGALDEKTDKLLTVHPDLKGSLLVLNNKLEFYAGLNGGRKICTYRDLVGENPFVRAQLDMKVTTEKLGFDGGVRANVTPSMDVHVGVRYRHTQNDLFYRQRISMESTGLPYNSFDLVYDETRQVMVLADVRWLASDWLTMDAGFVYHNYQMNHESHPWYRPVTEGNLKLNYRLDDHWNFNTSLLYLGGRYAQTYANGPSEVVRMKDVFDLGLGADYRVNEQMTVFARVDNLAHQKYQLYYNYPVTGIQFVAGLKMRF